MRSAIATPDVEGGERLVEQQQPRARRPAPGRSRPAGPGRRTAAPGAGRRGRRRRAGSARRRAARSASRRRRPRLRGPNATLSRAVRCGNSSSSWKTMPTRRRLRLARIRRLGVPGLAVARPPGPSSSGTHARQRAHQGRLAGAVGPDHGHHVPALRGQRARRGCARAGGRRRARRGTVSRPHVPVRRRRTSAPGAGRAPRRETTSRITPSTTAASGSACSAT